MAKAYYELAEVRPEGIATKIFRFRPVGSPLPPAKPGQFVKIFFPDEKDFRMFSVASAPGQSELEFCIKILPDGKFSQAIDPIGPGTQWLIEGPFGHFVYDGNPRSVFVAAGTGIAPVLSMLREIVQKDIAGDFALFYSNKTQSSILYLKELQDLARRHSGIRLICTLTQEQPSGWPGEFGRISGEMLAKYVKDPVACNWYSCGPLEFVKMVKEHAIAQGAQPAKIRVEGWG